jgi:hypothetical protein
VEAPHEWVGAPQPFEPYEEFAAAAAYLGEAAVGEGS